MKFGVFMELQYPKPWLPGGEQKLFQDALTQAELADKLGFDFVWLVEHHFLEEYAHCSSPEVFLAAVSQRTKNIRLAHGITLMPPGYNQPARVAERIATLDLVSNGRVEFGTGESSSRAELEGYGVPLEQKRDMWLEATEQAANMLAMDPYPGFEGKYFSMPVRNIIPKPVQKPHPPMWMACSNSQAIHTAAEHGLGALAISFVAPSEAKAWIDDYYQTIKTTCSPIGHTVNPNVAVVTNLSLDHDEEKAREKGLDGTLFFQVALAHHYSYGVHQPGRANLWKQYQSVRDLLLPTIPRGGPSSMGTPDQARELMREWVKAGADQVTFLIQSGNAKHEDICHSLELFAKEVMAEFHAGEIEREAKKKEELGPYVQAALDRKQWLAPLKDSEIPTYEAYNRPIVDKNVRAQGAEVTEDNWQVATKRMMEAVGLGPGDRSEKPSK